MGNKDVELKAIDFALNYEKEQGRSPQKLKQGKGYDIDSGEMKIEVKGVGKSNGFVQLNENNIKILQKEPNWILYIVYGVKTENPRLKIFSRVQVLERANFSISWGVPIRKADLETSIPLKTV